MAAQTGDKGLHHACRAEGAPWDPWDRVAYYYHYLF
jgi:hypothetical protein